MNLGVRHYLAAKLTLALVGLVVLTYHPHVRYLTVSSAHAEPGTRPAVGLSNGSSSQLSGDI